VIKSRMMRCVGNVAQMGEIRNAHKILVEKLEGKRLLGKSMNKWEYDIKKYLL
jgi:hypothetical protein